MELMTEEQKLATKSNIWKDRYERHRNSVICALDDLESKGDNIQTEGQMTFEDGMISCSVAQLAYGALRINDSVRAKKYLSRAIELDKKHQCLTQILIPDCRMNGATLRFWEYPYTVNLMHGGMNSPCGWSAWKIYGSWYLYLLTGEHKYMKQVINALGSCLQLVNINTHKLNFSFYLTHISIVTNSMRFLLVQAFLNFNASALENNTFPQSVTGTKNLMKLGVKMGD